MYRIDTGQARTDLYGIGKGAAQVLDLSPLRDQAARDQQENFAAKQAKEKEAQAKEAQIGSDLNALNKIAVLPREQAMFAEKQAALYDNVKKNIGAIRSGDVNALMSIQQQIGEINTQAELSKNAREQAEAVGKEMLGKGFDKYRKNSVDYLHDYISNPDNNGNYNFDPSQISEKFDFANYVNKDLAGYAHEQAPNRGGYKSNTQEERKQMLLDAVTSDPLKMRQANDDFEEAQDKLGAKTPAEYIANKYEKNLLVNDTPAVQQWQTEQNKNDINVTHTEKDNGGEVHVMNKANNEQITVDYNDKGEITGGTQGKRLTPTQSAENSAVYKSNIAKEKAYNQQKRAAELYRASLDLGNMKEADQKAALEKYNAMLPKKNAPTYTPTPLPYKEEGIDLDAKQAQEIAHDKFGIKPTDIIGGKTPSNVDVQHVNQKTKPASAEKIRVKRKSDGKTGSIDAKDFKPSKYDKI
jgi:hypothetical protein